MAPNTSTTHRDLLAVWDVLKEFRNLDNLIPVPWCIVFNYVALNPGKTQVEIAQATGVATSATTRAINLFREDLGMLRQEEGDADRRTKRVYLTAKGERFIQSLSEAVKGRTPK